MGEHAVEAVGRRRAGRTSALVIRAEHEVVDHQLRAAVEQLRQRSSPVCGLEHVLLLDRHPGKVPTLPGKLIPESCELLLALEQLRARREPLLACADAMTRHYAVSLSSPTPCP